jgi:hypothetical protein
MIGVLQATMVEMDIFYPGFAKKLAAAGWDLDTACIETRSGHRIHVVDSDSRLGGELGGFSDGDTTGPKRLGVSTAMAEETYRESKKVV